VDSSLGCSIRVRRDRIEYVDEFGDLSIDAEWAPGRGTWVIAFLSSIPDDARRPMQEVVARVGRAFEAAGWHLSTRT
jgi:hypothetical protein